MKQPLPLLAFLFVLTGCDPARFERFEVPITSSELHSFKAEEPNGMVLRVVSEIATEHNLTKRESNTEGLFYDSDRFHLSVQPSGKENRLSISLLDFPSLTRSELSKEIEAKLRQRLPSLIESK